MKIVCTIYYILTIMNNWLRYLINEIYLWSFSFWVMSDMYVRGLIWLLWFMVILSIICWYGFRVWHPSSLVSTLRLKFFFSFKCSCFFYFCYFVTSGRYSLSFILFSYHWGCSVESLSSVLPSSLSNSFE
jgi:hypothetical protein